MSFFDPEPDDPGGRSPGSVPQDDEDGDESSTDSTNVFEPEPNDPAGRDPGAVPQDDSSGTGGGGNASSTIADEAGNVGPSANTGGSGGANNDLPEERTLAGGGAVRSEDVPDAEGVSDETARDVTSQLERKTLRDLESNDVEISTKETDEGTVVTGRLTQGGRQREIQQRVSTATAGVDTADPFSREDIKRERARPNTSGAPPSSGSEGSVPASVEQQLEADLEEQTGEDLDRGEDFTISRTDEGFSAELTEKGQEAVAPDEQFGDVEITNPVTGNRLETDLEAVEAEWDQTIESTFAARESDDPTDIGPVVPLAIQGGAQALNPAGLALKGKEAGEFVFSEEGLGRGVTGENDLSDLGPQSRDLQDTDATAAEKSEQEEFIGDVDTRANLAIESAERSLRERPVETISKAAGGLAVGAIVGTAAGKRIPGVSGSDLSGKAMQATVKKSKRAGAGAKKLLKEDRAQAQIPRGRDKIDIDEEGFGSPDIDPEEQIVQKKQLRSIERDRRQRAEEERTAPGGDESDEPFTASTGDFRSVSGQQNVRAASRNPTARSRSGPTAQQRSTWRADTSDESPTKSGELIDEEGNVRDVDTETGTKSAADSATTAASQADAEVAGSLSGAMAASQAQSEQAADSPGRTDTRTDTGTTSQSQTDLDSLTDVEVRVDSRSDTRTDTRSDTDTRLDIDTRSDVDSRVDARVDIRADTRADLEFRNDLDIDLRSAEESDSRRRRRGAFSREFTNPVTDPGELDEALDFGGDL